MKLGIGQRELELGGRYLGTMRGANELMNEMSSLHARLAEDGYLLIRKLHDPQKVAAARRVILEDLDKNNQIDRSHPLSDAVISPTAPAGSLHGSKVTRTPEFLALVESPELMQFFGEFLGAPALTYDFKWLRVVGTGGFTGAHYDIVYMGRGTKNVYTVWTPLGDVPYELAPLAVLVGSHRFDRIRQTYGEMDVDRDNIAGWFSNDPVEVVDKHGGQWRTTEFEAGDALIFPMFTMHASLNHTSNRYRLSCDTRYQRADEPVDERWMGETPKGHYAVGKTPPVSMEDARKRWGV